jgi:hypothetical protein
LAWWQPQSAWKASEPLVTTAAPHSRALNVLLWVAPVLVLLALFRDGLNCWFIADDFAWLGLSRQMHGMADLPALLFAPSAQGTIRPLSERGFFLLFEALFGFDALPFRIMAFLTMAANIMLLGWIARRLTGSALAATVAGIVWASNTALMTVMTWSAAWNEALCPFFLLLALALFIRYAETGERRYWWIQLLVFVVGFGALEINVVYPALALAWALFVSPRDRLRKLAVSLVPLALLSAIYFGLHRAVAPFLKSGVYVLRFDSQIFKTLALYGKWSLLPVDFVKFGHSPLAGRLILIACVSAVLLLVVSELRKRRTIVLFGFAWFLITLAPVLPLPGHRTDYYLTIPLAGLGLVAAVGFITAGRAGRVIALAGLASYLAGMVPVSQSATRWSLNKTIPVRGLVLGVQAARRTHPDKIILIEGVSDQLYQDSVGQGAFYATRADSVYLTPGSELNLTQGPDLGDILKLVPDAAAVFHAVEGDQLVVYSIAGDHLRNITESYERSAPTRLIDPAVPASRFPGRVDVGNPLYNWLIGPSWLPSESGVRWMPGSATVRLRAPLQSNKLLLEGFCPVDHLKRSPRHLKVSVDGVLIGEMQLTDPESDFRRLFDIPAALMDKLASEAGRADSVEVEIRVDPVSRIGGQDFGVVFGKIALVN